MTKPNPEIIKSVYGDPEVLRYKDQIEIILTLTSMDEEKRKVYEPNAPSFIERLKSLKYLHEKGYKTSISAEPILETQFDKAKDLIDTLFPYVEGTFWLGWPKMLEVRLSNNGIKGDQNKKLSLPFKVGYPKAKDKYDPDAYNLDEYNKRRDYFYPHIIN